MTTRKRKKQQYEFLKDEVKVQKNGLLPCVAEKLFHIKQLEGEKFTMETLIREIPEMQTSSLFSLKKILKCSLQLVEVISFLSLS